MSQFLIVVCGAPRSRTTFMLDALLKHPSMKGSNAGDMRTNENPILMHSAFTNGDYTGLEKLHAHWCKDSGDVPLDQTDCPVEVQPVYAGAWKSAPLAQRAYMRCHWHLKAIAELSAIQIGAADYRRAAALTTRICSLVGLDTAAAVTAHFKTFSLTKLEAGPVQIAEEAIAAVDAKLAGEE